MNVSVSIALFLSLTSSAFLSRCRDGDAAVVASLPAEPGLPEDVAVYGGRAYVTAPATFANAGSAASRVYEIDLASGRILRDIVIEDQDPAADHALSGARFDGNGRLYVLAVPGGVIRMTLGAQPTQEAYATFPTLLPCSWGAEPGTPCTLMPFPTQPLPNDAAFGPDGSLYVTDSLQAVIFRVRPGGGEPEVWFQVPGFETIQPSEVNIGTNGIAIAPDRKSLVFGVTMSGQHAGTLFRLPLKDHPVLEDLTVFHKYVNQEAPDDMAFARSGRLYIALAGSNEISVLSPNGEELKRYSNVQAVGRDGKTVPFDAPAQPAFVGDLPFLLCTNHAYFTRDPNHYALLGMRVEDVGLRLIYPKDLP